MSTATVRHTKLAKVHTVDVGDGVIIVTTIPTAGGGYKAEAEVQYAPSGMDEYDALSVAISAALAAL